MAIGINLGDDEDDNIGQTKSLKCKEVGFEIFLHTYQTDLYSDGQKDTYLINSKKIKNVFND